MRSPLPLALLMLLLVEAAAGAAVAVPPFAAPPDLAVFGREVAQAVSAKLSQSGVEVAAGGSPVVGRIESLDADRVRLGAQLLGHAVQVEGPLEEVDRLATELAARLVPLAALSRRGGPPATGAGGPRPASPPGPVPTATATPPPLTHPLPAAPPVTVSPHGTSAAAPPAPLPAPPTAPASSASSTGTPAPVASTPPAPPPRATPPPVATAPVPSPSPASPAPPEPGAAAATPSAPAVAAAPVASTPTSPPAPPPPPAPAPPPSAPAAAAADEGPVASSRPVKPIPPPPVASSSPPVLAPARPDPGYESVPAPAPPPVRSSRAPAGPFQLVGRAVLHRVATADDCAGANSDSATRAARNVLDHLHVQTVITGCGIPSHPSVVMGELLRMGASAAVLASIETLTLEPVSGGFQPEGRIRVVVFRDGQARISRLIQARPHPIPVPDISRASYDVADAAFSRLASEIQAVLYGAR